METALNLFEELAEKHESKMILNSLIRAGLGNENDNLNQLDKLDAEIAELETILDFQERW